MESTVTLTIKEYNDMKDFIDNIKKNNLVMQAGDRFFYTTDKESLEYLKISDENRQFRQRYKHEYDVLFEKFNNLYDITKEKTEKETLKELSKKSFYKIYKIITKIRKNGE